ncbi:MAG: toll/interleukin-1 receptor domain-containing protein [Tannerellaceae bacterium]|jgi:pentatricopeptide repeat protein|nr:toll/interleukin-1 receptor domain-containing protein [Tannerellaceae bacterium]
MDNQKKDFFISYDSRDERWAKWIAATLEQANYNVTVMAWDFRPGQLFPEEMNRAIKNSERLIAVLSKAYSRSHFSTEEWAAFLAKKEEGNILPVRIEDFKPEGLWAARIYIDLVDKDEQEATQELLNGVSKEVVFRTGAAYPGKRNGSSATGAKPDTRVPYPGKTLTFGLPNRNPHFTGREAILDAIHRNFQKEELLARTQALIGLGGVGKSQIAVEYACRYAEEYTYVVWVNAESSDTFYASLEPFALKNGLVHPDAKYTSAELLAAVRDWMNRQDNWLFIFDNADDEASLKDYLPQDAAHRRHVLITSRYGNWQTFATPLNIDVFSEEEAAEFLTRRTGKPRDAFQDSLAKELGCLALALEQAAAYICNHADCDYREYLSLLEEYHLDVLKESSDIRTQQSVHATWDISIRKIADESAIQLLNLCAFFAPDHIDLSWFRKAGDRLPQPLRDRLPHKLHFNRTKEALTCYSLVNIRNGKLSLHRLLQEVLRERLKEEQSIWINYCIQVLNECVYPDFSTPESRMLFTELASHIHSVTALIDPEIQTEKLANLYFFLGYGYNEFAEYSQSLEWYGKAQGIQEKVLGTSHPDTAGTYNNIAIVYCGQGEYKKSLEWHTKALDIRETVLGTSHTDTAGSYNNIARVYCRQGEYDLALKWYRKALEVKETVFGTSHPDTATTYNNIAMIYTKQGEYEKALKWYRKDLEISEKVLGILHPDTATTYTGIGVVYFNRGEYAQALEWHLKALEIKEKVLGASHPDTATTYAGIAMVYYEQDDYEQSLKWYLKALDMQEKVLGSLHPDTATTYYNIALVYDDQGEYDQALKWYLKALNIQETVLGVSHPDTATVYTGIATAYCEQGEYDQALEWFAKALPVCVGKLGIDHPNTKLLFENMEIAYNNSGNPKPFAEWLKEHGGAF